MTDGGLIEGSAPSGDAGSEYVTVFEAGGGGDTALAYGAADDGAVYDTAFVDESAYAAAEEAPVYTEATASSEIAFGDTSGSGGGRAGCSSGSCPHPVAHPAEADWEQLVSAVPVEGQLGRFKPRCEGMSYPTEDDFRSAVAAVRPLEPDSFSLERLRTGWTEEVAAVLADWPALLRSKLAELATGWAGTDFDAFAETADLAKGLVQGVLDDIEDAAAELKHREEAIYTLQGGDSGEIPYPAPLVGADGEWTSLVAIHVRPAWWHGDCIQMGCEEAEAALRLGGADPALAAEVRSFIEERAGSAAVDAVVSDVRLQAGGEAATAFAPRISAELAAYAERHAAIDESIGEKLGGQSEQLAAMRTAGADRPYPDSADASYMDLEPPVMEEPAPPVPPQATQDPSPVPPGGDGSVRTEDAATESAPTRSEADGTVTGGLASGGGGFGAFGGGAGGVGGGVVPGGTATVAGAGAGFTGAAPGVFPPGGATGPGAAGGSGSGSSVGAARGAVAAGRPADADARKKQEKSEEDEAEEQEDLLFRETDDVWGYVRPGDDPYS
ncbi:hypothetical protein [Glycomyces terrestris]|uniref:Uncharacterized protein n=1 Tax=Glycomyces terrestris TaxID=2493553 RepID=A0A426USG5_9ACTN|nr:hypothetical protein [Glycomyces terrestris]RRR96072.1 hypothetical protein EIW28_22680 [Glycomyces terrestris]